MVHDSGKLPRSTCPGCSVPEPYRSHDWVLVPAKPGLQGWILMNECTILTNKRTRKKGQEAGQTELWLWLTAVPSCATCLIITNDIPPCSVFVCRNRTPANATVYFISIFLYLCKSRWWAARVETCSQWRTQEFCSGGGAEDRENGDLGAAAPLVRGSGGSCNLVQHLLNFWYYKTIYYDNQFICHC